MANIDYGTGPNTASGDTQTVALAKLRDRLLAAGVDPNVTISSASSVATVIAAIEVATQMAEAKYVPGVVVPPITPPVVTPTPVPTPTPTPTPTAPALTISGTPATAQVGSGATFTPTISGGTSPYTLTLVSGIFPAGRSLSGLTVTGTYTTAATYNYTLRATDSAGAAADLPLSVTVAAMTAATYLVAGTNSRNGDNKTSIPSGSTAIEFKDRVLHLVGFACSSLAYSFRNWGAYGGSGEFDADSDAVVIKAGWEWQGVGTAPMTVGGQRGFTISKSAFEVLSDEVTPASFGSSLSAFPRDARIFRTVIYQSATGDNLVAGCCVSLGGSGYVAANDACGTRRYDPANRIDDVDTAGPKTFPSGSASQYGLPGFLLGKPVATNPLPVSVFVIGDSIAAGFGDSVGVSLGGTGYIARSSVDSNGANAIAMGHSTRSGDRLGDWLASNARRKQDLIQGRSTSLVNEMFTNDLTSTGSGPSTAYDGSNKGSPEANNEFNFNALVALAKSGSSRVQWIDQTNLFSRDASTDNWTTKANQTVPAAWAAGGARDGLETYVASKVSDGTINRLINVRAAGADPNDNHYWNTDGSTAYLSTGDGTHPSQVVHVAATTIMRNALTSISFGPVISMGSGVTQAEGNSGTTALNFPVTRSGPTTAACSASWAVVPTGTNGADASDFVGGSLQSGTVSFAAGATSATISVNVQGDTTVEPNETFNVVLSNPSPGASIGTSTSLGTILNDDTGPLTISGSRGNVTTNSSAPFTPTIAGGTSPYTLSIVSGTLPPGRSISGLSVVGTYTTAGNYSYTLRVTDAAGATADDAVTAAVGQPATFISDTFTDTDGTALESHTPEGGGSWSKHPLVNTGAAYHYLIGSGRLYTSANPVTMLHSAIPASANYKVRGVFTMPTFIVNQLYSVLGRHDASAASGYIARPAADGTSVTLAKVASISSTTVISTYTLPTAWVAGETHTLELVMNGTTISVIADGTTVISVTDSSVTAVGQAGIRSAQSNTGTTGLSITEFTATAL